MYPSEKLDQLMLRMPDGLRPRLKAMAALNRRTMSAEAVFHLERALASATAATGEGLANTAPAAASDSTARQSGPIHPRS